MNISNKGKIKMKNIIYLPHIIICILGIFLLFGICNPLTPFSLYHFVLFIVGSILIIIATIVCIFISSLK